VAKVGVKRFALHRMMGVGAVSQSWTDSLGENIF
jgi:hypothetical protein